MLILTPETSQNVPKLSVGRRHRREPLSQYFPITVLPWLPRPSALYSTRATFLGRLFVCIARAGRVVGKTPDERHCACSTCRSSKELVNQSCPARALRPRPLDLHPRVCRSGNNGPTQCWCLLNDVREQSVLIRVYVCAIVGRRQ